MTKLSYVAAAILLAQSAHSFESNGTLVGSVKDLQSHLSGVLITVKGHKSTAVTDYRGRFELPNVKSGEYTLVVSYMGYDSAEVQVKVIDSEITLLDPITLNLKQQIEEVVSVSQIFRGEMAAANNQKMPRILLVL
tara:strand:+ start:242 stop:649 length:408 start_codon:yes stop_codon:yes gene_type:complete